MILDVIPLNSKPFLIGYMMYLLKFYAGMLMFSSLMGVALMFLSLNSATNEGGYLVVPIGIGIFSSLAILEVDRRLGLLEKAVNCPPKENTTDSAG